VAAAAVSQIESNRITRQKPPHDVRNRGKPGAQQKMKMVVHQCPCKTPGLAAPQSAAQPLQKIIAIGVVPENLPPLDASRDDMVQGTRCI
jgi:hypothetical protein